MGSLLMGLMTATLSRNISLNEREALLMKTLDKVVPVVLFVRIFTSKLPPYAACSRGNKDSNSL